MHLENVYVTGTGTCLPEPTTLSDAEARGLVERKRVWRTQLESVCLEDTLSAPEMAGRAGRAAVEAARVDPADVALLLHASTWYQGWDLFPAASYVQRVALDNDCPAIGVDQMSNGGLAALELAAGYLGGAGRDHALVTTGDRFSLPGCDRWRSDPGTVFADGGTAMVLSRRGGPVRVRAVVTVSDPGLERMSRGDDPAGNAPFSVRSPIDLDAHRAVVVAELGMDGLLDRMELGHREAVKQALSDAGLELDDVDRFVLPNLGMARLKAHFLGPLGIDLERTTWDFGRRLGHLGAGDQIAGLDHLLRAGALRSGQTCLLLGVGAGFSWSAAVLQGV